MAIILFPKHQECRAALPTISSDAASSPFLHEAMLPKSGDAHTTLLLTPQLEAPNPPLQHSHNSTTINFFLKRSVNISVQDY